MALDPAHYEDCRKYGRWQSTTADRVEGDVITVHLINEDATEACFDIYYLSPATYESAFAEAGLREFSWEALSVSQAGLEAYPKPSDPRPANRCQANGFPGNLGAAIGRQKRRFQFQPPLVLSTVRFHQFQRQRHYRNGR